MKISALSIIFTFKLGKTLFLNSFRLAKDCHYQIERYRYPDLRLHPIGTRSVEVSMHLWRLR